jgi:hypothetical protein
VNARIAAAGEPSDDPRTFVLMRRVPRRRKPRSHALLAARVSCLEEALTSLRVQHGVLWALAPVWLREALAGALAGGWTIECMPEALKFSHPRQEDFSIPLPVPAEREEQLACQRKLQMRLGFVGRTGLRSAPSNDYRPRVMDLPADSVASYVP